MVPKRLALGVPNVPVPNVNPVVVVAAVVVGVPNPPKPGVPGLKKLFLNKE